MNRRDLLTLASGAVCCLVLATYCVRQFKVSNDMVHFLPDAGDQQLAKISEHMAESPSARTLILSIQGADSAQAREAARELAQRLRAHAEVAHCAWGPDEHFAESAFDLIFPHRFQLYSSHPEQEIPALLSDAGLAAAADNLKEQLALPTAPLVKKLAPSDPLLLFPAIVKRLLEAGAGSVSVVDGQFVSSDGQHAILFVETKHSAFDGEAQIPFLDLVTSSFDTINQSHGGGLRLEKSGLSQFAVFTEKIIRADVQRISTFSTLAIVALFLLLFRSVRVLVLSFIPLGCALLAALAVSLALYGEVQGLTLALGSALIGVCVDYPIYFLNYQALVPDPAGPHATLRGIRTALGLGAITTIAGFVGLAWTSFPGLRELAVFATAGIVAAFAATVWLLPSLSAAARPPVGVHQALADLLGRGLERMVARRANYIALAGMAVAVCLVGLPRVRWRDDPSVLNRLDDRLLAEDSRVREEISRMDTGSFIISTGSTANEAEERNDLTYERLLKERAAGELDGFMSVHDILFSPSLQARNVSEFRSSPGDRVSRVFAAHGFRPGVFDGYQSALAQSPAAPLALAQLLNSPLRDVVKPFTVDLGEGAVGLISLVRGVRDETSFGQRLSDLRGTHFFNQSAFLAKAYGTYRERALRLLLVGIAVMLAIVYVRYRRVRLSLAAALPALIAAPTTLAIFGLAGVETNLLHVVAVVLVLSAGEDYAIFLLASRSSPATFRASAASVAQACLATVLGFGLLGVSQIPALQALGWTTGIGILLAVMLAPLALVVAGPETAQ